MESGILSDDLGQDAAECRLNVLVRSLVSCQSVSAITIVLAAWRLTSYRIMLRLDLVWLTDGCWSWKALPGGDREVFGQAVGVEQLSRIEDNNAGCLVK